MIKFYTQLRAHKFAIAVSLIIIILATYYFLRPAPLPSYETATVKLGDVVQDVSVTGRVNSETEVNLAFEKGGRVSSEPRAVGTRVRAGDVLVRLDATELTALRTQAKANSDFEQANLAQLRAGTRAEDIAISSATVASAESARDDARTALLDKLATAGTVADDALFAKTDFLLENPRTFAPRALFTVSDQKLVGKVEQARASLTQELADLSGDGTDIEVRLADHKLYFTHEKNYLDLLSSGVNAALPSFQNSQATIDGWKTSVSLARTNMSSAMSALLASEQAYRSAQSALTVANNQLALKKAGPTASALAAQEAKIGAMRATLANYDAQIAKLALRAPFAGVITKQDAKYGETVSPNVPVVSLMSDGAFKIEANVPEVDVAKISVGDEAKVTLDAYGSDAVFAATVTTIDPAETILEGVSTYKVTLHFTLPDERIRSGMTANIDIATDKKVGVLSIPLRAVVAKDGGKFVRVPQGGGISEVPVTLGLRGSDGTVEVLSGLRADDKVITFSAK
jgi:RND family efflux transporter MFP subunit